MKINKIKDNELYEHVSVKNNSILFKLIRKGDKVDNLETYNTTTNNNEELNTNDKLFFKIWRNCVIREMINEHVRIYMVVNKGVGSRVCYNNIRQVNKLAHKDYIKHLVINSNEAISKHDFKLPTEITTLEFQNFNQQLRHFTTSFSTLIFGSKFKQKLSNGLLLQSITRLEFGEDYNQAISPNILPSSIRILKFGDTWNQDIQINTLPPYCLSIEFGNSFNRELNPLALPPTIRYLKLGNSFNRKLELVKFKSLLKLEFNNSSEFNQEFAIGDLPESLTSLSFGLRFNQSLSTDILPPFLKSLKFIGGSNFNQEFQVGYLPQSLKKIVNLGGQTLQIGLPILPSSLTSLDLGFYNSVLRKGDLPNTLLYLNLGKWFDQELTIHSIPKSVTHLNLGLKFNKALCFDYIPSSVTQLDMGKSYNHELFEGIIPSSVKDLKINFSYQYKLKPLDLPIGLIRLQIERGILIESGMIPNTVKTLICSFLNEEEIKPGAIPSSVTDLNIRSICIPLLIGSIPSSVEKLDFRESHDYIKFSPGVLPNSIKELYMPFCFNFDLESGLLPSSCTELYFCRDFNQPLYNIPPSIKLISFGYNFNREITTGQIPNVTALRLPFSYPHKLTPGVIPNVISLKYIKYGY